MGTAWWSTNVLAFTPAMDVGATRYTIFIRAAMTNGVNYRANGTITMRNAPGFTPNTLPLPVPSIDFATVTPTNAPWLLAELDPGIPAAIASAVAQAGTNTTTGLATKVSTNDATYLLTVSKAASAYAWGDHSLSGYLGTSTWTSWLSTNSYVKVESDPVAMAALAGKVGTNETRHVVLNTMEVMNGIRTAGNVLSVSPGTRELYDSDGRISIDWTGRVLTDGSFVQSIDWENRSLTDHHQLGSIRWDSRELAYDNYEIALDWGTSNQFKVGGALLVNGTNVITELNLKASSADMAGKYDASNPANYVDAVAVSNATNGLAGSVPGIVRAMVHTNQTWAATGTNATYRMSWDVTNGTFRVEEILP
jgi:hypothetical protein